MAAPCGTRTGTRRAPCRDGDHDEPARRTAARVAPMVPENRAVAQRRAGAGAVKPVTIRERRVNSA
ncbi:hypothetical protein KBK24_0124395 [Burkholderia sp. K24]|nr:hypothetical protein KBK24_0124395 [Burkholderia sp. K24]